MSKDESNPEMTLQQQLVAYLDGELDTRQSRQVEQLLADDPEVRERLRELDHTWEMLGELDDTPAEADADLTQATLETVAMKAGLESEGKSGVFTARRRALLLSAALATAAIAGFLAFSLFLPKHGDTLAENVSLLSNLDDYRQAADIEFVRSLDKRGLFAGDMADLGEVSPGSSGETDLSQLDSGELRRLAESLEAFEAMPVSRRDRLRRFHEQLDADADSARLRGVMRGYVDWLATRPPHVRASLCDMPVDRRVRTIERMLAEKSAAAARKSGDKPPGGKTGGEKQSAGKTPEARSAQALIKWFFQYATRHEEEIRKAAAENKLAGAKKRGDQPSRAQAARLLAKLWQTQGGSLPFSSESDLKKALAALPEKARKKLATKPPEKQWQAIAVLVKKGSGNRPGTGKRNFPPLQQEERLNQFFEKSISKEQRRRLMELPSEQFDSELRKLYELHEFQDSRKSFQERSKRADKLPPKPGRKKPPAADTKQREPKGEKKPDRNPAKQPATRP